MPPRANGFPTALPSAVASAYNSRPTANLAGPFALPFSSFAFLPFRPLFGWSRQVVAMHAIAYNHLSSPKAVSRPHRVRELPMPSIHVPVLLREVLSGLQLAPGSTVVDGTVGGGGHSRE